MDDRDLLREYVESQSEQAFAELVTRHINLVYATALRIVGESQMAHDVAQTVFIRLARKAHSLREGNALPGWLYRAACGVAKDTLRLESRRRRRETEAMNRADLDSNSQVAWEAIMPLLDEAMQQLNRLEQNAVVLRFLQGKSFRETALALAVSEDAAQKRVSRAIDKLRVHFKKRGLAVSATAMVAALETHSLQAAPAGLAAGVASLAGTMGSTGLSAMIKTLLMTKAKAAIVIAAVSGAILTSVVLQHQKIARLQQEQADLNQQLIEARLRRAEAQSLAEQLQIAREQLQAQTGELLRLRGQATALQQAQLENTRLKAERDRLGRDSSAEEVYPTTPRLATLLANARAAQGSSNGPVILGPEVNVQLQYGNLFQKLNLTPNQIAMFEKIMREEQEQTTAVMREHPFVRNSAVDRNSAEAAAEHEQYQEHLQALLQPVQQAAESQIRQLLGSGENYDYYRTYTDQQKERMVVMGGYREGLDAAGVPPLTLDQVEHLIALAYQQRLSSSNALDGRDQQTQQLLQQAAAFLTSDQVRVLAKYTTTLMSPATHALGR